jgi:UDP-N-acetylmuramate: L-alanyl-gamma-D-glutamyl-meso-diaminopimelate ligase
LPEILTVRVHLIAIGGSAMHNLAIALHRKGLAVTGSDDEIFEPSKSRLNALGLLPDQMGWFPEKLDAGLDAVIVGMHARQDNPELSRARELGLRIYSYPEYLYEQTRNKIRVVIGGSHGKTSITAMVLHVLSQAGVESDYMVGAQLAGVDCMVSLSEHTRFAVLEGDEYLSSPTDLRPKFHLYHPHIALISGIAWDHINVFPTFDNYVEQFRIFVRGIESGGCLIYCEEDQEVTRVAAHIPNGVEAIGYQVHPHAIRDGVTWLITGQEEVPVLVFGRHNLQNLSGAMLVCEKMGVSRAKFYDAIRSFPGAARRLELVRKGSGVAVYKDFAHSPSKLRATTTALREQYPERKLVACMELHTFSSLNAAFLDEYKGTMEAADKALVYFNPHTIAHKKLPDITAEQVKGAFASDNVEVFTDSSQLTEKLLSMKWNQANLLMMTSGNFDGVNMEDIAERIVSTVMA